MNPEIAIFGGEKKQWKGEEDKVHGTIIERGGGSRGGRLVAVLAPSRW